MKTDLTELYKELDSRDDEGKRFYREVIVDEEYKVAKTGKQDMVIIDLGANLGDFSYYMYDDARVIYAIEANEKNYNDLVDYVTRYNLTKIKPYFLAIAGENKEQTVYAHGGCGGYSIYESSESTNTVQGKTLAQFMKDEGIEHVDLLKIDVECAEEDIFNAPDFSEVAPHIDYIVGENHGKNINTPLEKTGFTVVATDKVLQFTAKRT